MTSQDIHCFHESLQHAPCGTLTSKHMQIFVPRYVPSLLRNKEHTMWPPWPHLHVILEFFSRQFLRGQRRTATPPACFCSGFLWLLHLLRLWCFWWPGFMQDLTLMVIDEGQQYGTDREIATISLLKQQPLILWTGDAQQTPGGIARTAPNAKRSRQLLLAKKHGLRSDRNYYMPSNLAEAMIRLLDDSSNEGLHLLNQTLRNSEHVLGRVWTEQLSPNDEEDLRAVHQVLPGLNSHFRAALPTKVDATLLEGTTINFSRSLIRLAWMLQHVETLLPIAGEIQAELNSHTAGVSDIHAWGAHATLQFTS